MTHQTRSGTGHPGPRQLLSLVGIAGIAIVVLAHLLGGAALVHTGLVAPLVARGPGAVLLGLVALVAVKLTVVVGARWWWR